MTVPAVTEAEIYEFLRGEESWFYTPHEFALDFDGRIYAPVQMTRSRLALTAEASKSALELTVQSNLPVVRAAMQAAPGDQVMTVLLRVAQRSPWDIGWSIAGTRWIGRVLGAQVGEIESTLRCESAHVSLKRVGLRRLYSRKCSHVLYSTHCGAAEVAATATVESVDARRVVMAGGVPAGVVNALAGGWLETLSGARHMLSSSDATSVELLYPVSLQPGDLVDLVAGCDHTTATCASRFANLDNFGGFPGIPPKNPFSAGVF
mgnify:CR=1 FL=1|jgi:uncharacterized phage protein (TIGR02218 family)